MIDEIQQKLDAIDWDNPKVTVNETILKTMVEELLLLVAEETNEIADYRRILFEKRNSKKPTLKKEDAEDVSIEGNNVDYTERLKQLAQLVKGIHVIALQMKEERERAKEQHENTINQLLRENAFLKEQLDQKNRSELNSPFKTPVRTLRTKNTVVKARLVRKNDKLLTPEKQKTQGSDSDDSDLFE